MGDAVQKNFEDQFFIYLSTTQLQNYTSFHQFTGEQWTTAVLADLNRIAGSQVGGILLRSIGYWRQPVWIVPIAADPNAACNATTASEDLTSAIIQFTPMSAGPCSKKDVATGGIAHASFETLFHELVHAFRRVSGKNKLGVALGKGLSFYSNKEEFIAVMVQGILASSIKVPVRSSHFKHFEIDSELNGSFKFFRTSADTYRYVKEFCMENPGFTRRLASIDTPFNPVRAYYSKPAVAKSISQHSQVAARRDKLMPIVKATKEFIQEELDNFYLKYIDQAGRGW